jgi:hypothetical protein
MALPLRPGDFLAAVLDDHVPVGHGQRVGVADVDLLLAGGGLALGIFDRNAGALQTVADRPHDVFFLGRLEDVVVLVIAAGELQVAVSAFARAVIGLVEQEEFEFGGHIGLQAHGFQPGDLALQDGARRMRHFLHVYDGRACRREPAPCLQAMGCGEASRSGFIV